MEPNDPSFRPFLQDFVAELNAIFGSELNGVYLHGSIALEAFHPESSDVDFTVVLNTSPGKKSIKNVAALHRRLDRDSKWGSRLDGFYLVKETDGLCTFPDRYFATRFRARIGYGAFPVVARHILHRHGIALLGSAPGEVFAKVSPEELRKEMNYNLNVYWHRRMKRPWFFLFDEAFDFAVTTLPRILFTQKTGRIISKEEGLRFLEKNFPEWSAVAANTRLRMKGKAGSVLSLAQRMGRMATGVRFIRTMIEVGNKSYHQ